MKGKLTLLLLLIAASQITAGAQTDLQRRGLKGRVKYAEHYETYFCCSPNQRKRGPRRLSGVAAFNKKGRLIEWIDINNDGNGPTYERQVYAYDHRGYKTSVEVFRSDKNPPDTFFTFQRDPAGRTILSPARSEKLSHRTFFAYDAGGRVIEETTRDTNENLMGKRIFGYDREGNMSRVSVLRADGELEYEAVTVFTDSGRTVETTNIRPGTEIQRSVVFKDDNGRVKKGETFGLKPDGGTRPQYILLTRSVYEYTAGGEKMDWIFYKPDGSPESKIVMTSDGRGDVQSREEFSAGPLPPGSKNEGIEPSWEIRRRNLYRREYDRKGNIVGSETLEQCAAELPLELATIYETVITYY